jgi:hypothetical protein
MAKKVIRSIVIFWGIIAIFPLCYFIYAFFTVGQGSYWIFGARDGQASVSAWLDKNANGIREQNEHPLPGICIWSGYRPDSVIRDYSDPCQFSDYAVTDEQGIWEKFLPNGSCDTFYVFAKAPDGFQPTTDLASNSCSAQFGFVENSISVSHKVLSINDFARRQITILWVKRIGIGLFMLVIASIGTFWLEKKV